MKMVCGSVENKERGLKATEQDSGFNYRPCKPLGRVAKLMLR